MKKLTAKQHRRASAKRYIDWCKKAPVVRNIGVIGDKFYTVSVLHPKRIKQFNLRPGWKYDFRFPGLVATETKITVKEMTDIIVEDMKKDPQRWINILSMIIARG